MEPTTTDAGRPRRLLQPERSAATRQALLDSTIDCLVELGYQRSTTTEISERAGLSRGAHQHHFQTRATLFEAAASALAERARADIERMVDELPTGTARRKAALDGCWQLFSGSLFQAVLELSVQARSDPQLRESLGPAERLFGSDAVSALRPAFGDKASDRGSDELIATVLATIRGVALLRVLEPDYDPAPAWEHARRTLLGLLNRRSSN
jgi:AcrR family transcriptional regulator